MDENVQLTGSGLGEKKRRYGWLIFILGLVLGSVATLGIVQRAIPYLQLSVFDRGVAFEGKVLKKQAAEQELQRMHQEDEEERRRRIHQAYSILIEAGRRRREKLKGS